VAPAEQERRGATRVGAGRHVVAQRRVSGVAARRRQDADSLDTESVLLALKDPVLGLRISTKKIGFGRSKPNAFTARELLDWVLTSLPQIERRHDAVLLARRLHAEGHLQSAQGDESFRDSNRVWQYGAGFRFIMPESEQKKLLQHSQQFNNSSSSSSKRNSSSSTQSTSSLPQTLVRAFSGAGRSSERAAAERSHARRPTDGDASTASTSHKPASARRRRPRPQSRPARRRRRRRQRRRASSENLKDSSRRKVRKHARRGTVTLDSNTVGESLSRNSSTSSSELAPHQDDRQPAGAAHQLDTAVARATRAAK
jgi:hypothetical protein